jgi:hypothetical protein
MRKPRVPSYRLHKPSGNAVVTLAGKDIYLGTYNCPESREAYDRRIGEWLASGRQAPAPSPCLSLATSAKRPSSSAAARNPRL